MKKKIPNIISSIKIIIASIMLFFTSITNIFLSLYVVCSISTMASIETVIIQLTRKEFKY